MHKFIFVEFMILVLAACGPQTVQSPNDGTQYVETHLGDVAVGLSIPYGWDKHMNDEHLWFAEAGKSTQEAGPLHGIVVNIWHPSTLDMSNQMASSSDYSTSKFLSHVTQSFDADVVISPPQPFMWDGHDAAYYLVTDEQQTVSIIVALTLPDDQGMIAANISAPHHDFHEVRDLIGELFEGLTINGQAVDVTDLVQVIAHVDLPENQEPQTFVDTAPPNP